MLLYLLSLCGLRNESSGTQETKDLTMLGNLVMFLIAFGMFSFALGFDFMLPNGPMWATILLWLASYLAGRSMEKVGIPALLGMLVAGIVLRNLPGDPMQGLPESWSAQFRAFGLSLILMRSGLELDIPMIKKQGLIAARLTVCPGVCEAFTICGMAVLLFNMPFALALSCGFVLAAVSPAVVVSGMFDLHKRGYGVAKGLPSLVVAAASFDDVVAISGFAMCIGLAVKGGDDPILGGMHGPINLIGGSLCGYIGGYIAGCTAIWNSKWKRSAITILIGLFFMFGATMLHYNGGGAMAGLMTGIFASMCWQNGWCGALSTGPSNSHHHEVEHHIAKIWGLIAQPLLFGVIGASVDFRELELNVIPKAVLAVAIGMCVRVPIAFLVTGGKDFNFKERSFIGLSWIPKATVQAALGSVPLDLIRDKMDHDDPDFDKWEQWGKEILVTAVISILLTAPIGLVCISKLGPRWLEHSKDATKDVERSDSQANLTGSNVISEPENWALMEEARRASPEGLAQQARTQTSRFFSRMVDEMKATRALLYKAKKAAGDEKGEGEEEVRNALVPKDEEKMVSVNLGAMDKPISGNMIDQVLERLDIIDEGIEAVWRVIDEQGDAFPTSDLFITSGGNYQNVPTYQEISRKLSSILSDEEAARGDDDGVVRRTSFNGFVPSRAHIELYHQPMRSFTGYKPSAQHIELYKQQQREMSNDI